MPRMHIPVLVKQKNRYPKWPLFDKKSDFTKKNPELVTAMRRIFHDEATEADKQLVNEWVAAKWAIATAWKEE